MSGSTVQCIVFNSWIKAKVTEDKLIPLLHNKLTYEFNNKETNDLTWSENLLEVTGPTQNINVCCSGGLDSDVILRLFAKTKKVSCFIGRWMNDGVCYNDYDIKHAIGSANSPGIDYKFIDLDFEKFFESGEFINYGTVYPQVPVMSYILNCLMR